MADTEQQKAQHKARREGRKANCLCISCGAPSVKGLTRCEAHRKDNNRRSRARQIQLSDAGNCKTCGNPSRPGLKTCAGCADADRARSLRRLYNISLSEYEKILKHQKGGCFICGRPAKTKRLSVDHNHKTGLIRGLLCDRDNKALGLLGDDAERIERLLKYLKFPSAVLALGSPRFGLKGRTSNKASTRRRLNKAAA